MLNCDRFLLAGDRQALGSKEDAGAHLSDAVRPSSLHSLGMLSQSTLGLRSGVINAV